MDLMESEFCVGKVSIVTPVYNGEAFLAKMLDSVLAQRYRDIEMILVDDGSLDGTVTVAEGYRENFAARGIYYRIVRAEHRSASAAINEGLSFVTGEYLIWPDSDDILEPSSVGKRVEFLEGHPEYQCVRSLSYYFDAETGKRSDKADEQQGDLFKEDLFWDILEGRTFVCCGCYMLKSAAFFAIYPERKIPEYGVGQNFQMLLPFMYRHKCPTIREELYGVSIRVGSHSRRALTRTEEELKYRDYEKLIDDIAEICHIADQTSRDRISCWKIRREYNLSMKYGNRKRALIAMKKLYQYGDWKRRRPLKEILWFYFVNGWVEKKIYPVYQAFFRKKHNR